MKIKSHKQFIDGHNTVTFFCEDVSTNTLIHSDTFIVNRQTKIKQLKADFTNYVLDMKKMERAMLEAESHKLMINKVLINGNNDKNVN